MRIGQLDVAWWGLPTFFLQQESDVNLAKRIMPYGARQLVVDGKFVSRWAKHGGHAGSTVIDRCVERAKAEGFVVGKLNQAATPDGSVSSSCGVYSHSDGWEMWTYRTYGAVAADNRFVVELNQV
jgi:hypothetical protein